jgi:hypothetical protein
MRAINDLLTKVAEASRPEEGMMEEAARYLAALGYNLGRDCRVEVLSCAPIYSDGVSHTTEVQRMFVGKTPFFEVTIRREIRKDGDDTKLVVTATPHVIEWPKAKDRRRP